MGGRAGGVKNPKKLMTSVMNAAFWTVILIFSIECTDLGRLIDTLLYQWESQLACPGLYIENKIFLGYPETDEQVAKEILEALTQFMLVYPSMVSGGVASKTPVYAFGESYGGSYVISLAKVYLDYRFVHKNDF